MNKLLLFIAFCLSATFSSTAQKIQFTDSLNVWLEEGADASAGIFTHTRYYYKGDTIINGLFYRTLYDQYCSKSMATWPPSSWICYNSRAGFMRDTVGKVYWGSIDNGNFSEVVLYDYTLQEGDSTVDGQFVRKIIKVDSVSINGIYHKVWRYLVYQIGGGASENYNV